MTKIRTHGLMTAAERQSSNVTAGSHNGAVFGDGIYTANNGTNFRGYGDCGIIVCRLQGKAVRVTGSLSPSQLEDVNTVIGDKRALFGGMNMNMGSSSMNNNDSDGWPNDDTNHEVVLRSSKQCLPVVRFDEEIRSKKQGRELIRYIKYSLQQILEKRLNNGHEKSDIRKLPLVRPAPISAASIMGGAGAGASFPLPPSSNAYLAASLFGGPPPSFAASASSVNPSSFPPARTAHRGLPSWRSQGIPTPYSNGFGTRLGGGPSSLTQQTLHYNAPRKLNSSVPTDATTTPPASCDMNEECAICMDQLNVRTCVALRKCNHVFHADCIQQAFSHSAKCPTCRKSIGDSVAKGKSPSGDMTISTSSMKCSGFRVDSILINYTIPSGQQKIYHDNPGNVHSAKYETAYLPNNDDGKALLKRLMFAFMHGLTFTVGVSMTSGAPNCCTVRSVFGTLLTALFSILYVLSINIADLPFLLFPKWASIHHKTSPTGGSSAHGFPDSDYFVNCNEELDALGVPPAQSLDDNGNAKK